MTSKDFSNEELRAALAAADRTMRLPYVAIVGLSIVAGLATAVALKVADWANPVHVLIVCVAVWLWAWQTLGGFLLQARQLAANARILRALELMDERLGEHSRG
jgi:hypothetical protein